MAYQALYRKWRPATFDDVVGQGHVVTTLKNEIISGKTAHAYLFCGTRGTGKTSCAKIFARAINCLNPKNGNPCNVCEICRGVADGSILDITEIDAASNNGVDNIREIRDEVSYSAAQARYKIYIIDEVHMLSAGAFNALLKTLEEPPPYVVFILATTEVHKLPATITSRCQRFDFKRISVKDIVIRLREIVTADKIKADVAGLELIARLADGAMRDALSILDQCVCALPEGITKENVTEVLGIASDDLLDRAVSSIRENNSSAILELVAELSEKGRDLTNFMESLMRRFRDILVCQVTEQPERLFAYSDETVASLKKQAAWFTATAVSSILESLGSAVAEAKWAKNQRIQYELALIKLCDVRLDSNTAALARRIEQLERRILGEGAEPAHTESESGGSVEAVETGAMMRSVSRSAEPEKEEKLCQSKPPLNERTISKPPVGRPRSGSWADVLSELKQSSAPLYGALCIKKAKAVGDTLYFVNEDYVRSILTAFATPMRAAMEKVFGSEMRISFVPEAQFDNLSEQAAQTSPVSDKQADDLADQPTTVQTEQEVQHIQVENGVHAEHDTEAAKSEEIDPLDALLSSGNADVHLQEE